MEDLADGIKTKSLTEALEALTEQVLEISSLTINDFCEQDNLDEILQHMSQGIQTTTTNLCLILENKIKLLNPSLKTPEKLKAMMTIAEEAAGFSLELTLDEVGLEEFQEKIVWLLESVLKLMILWDQELILNLKLSIEDLRLPLIEMRKTQFVKEIVFLYKEYVAKLAEFSEVLCNRIHDLTDQKIQNEFWIHLSCVQKLSISFARVIKNIASYPLSKHSKTSKEFIVKEILSLLDEIEELLDLEKPEGSQNGATFLNSIDGVLDHLERNHFDDEELKWRMQLILQHSMTVSKFSSDDDREKITRYSQRTLNEYRSLQSTLQNMEQSPSGDISLAVDILRDFLELLEQSVNHSLLRMMVENLSICTEPIRRLVQRCTIQSQISDMERTTSDLAVEVQEFDNVMERVLQTCFFALSSTGDLLKIQVIRSSFKLLESLEAEVVPAVYSCYLDPDNKAAFAHLSFLWHSFREHCKHLQTSLDAIADPLAFCHIAEKVLTEHVTILRKNLYSQDLEILDRHCRPIEAIVLRCHSLLEQQEWGKLLSNKIYLSEIKLTLNEFRGAYHLTMENISDLSSHRSMLKRAELVLKYLMKSIDTMKVMQDSEILQSFITETFRNNTTRPPPSLISAFPDSVNDLPRDPTMLQDTICLSRTLIGGRTPKNRLAAHLEEASPSDQNTDVKSFIEDGQPWRTRCSVRLCSTDEGLNFDSITSQNCSVNQHETFDLTEILEELSSLEGTLTSARTSAVSLKSTTPRSTIPENNATTVNSVSVTTPQRLRDLQIVTERLAALRAQQKVKKLL